MLPERVRSLKLLVMGHVSASGPVGAWAALHRAHTVWNGRMPLSGAGAA